MKKYILLTLTLILSACTTIDTSDLVNQVQNKITQANTDYKLTYVYTENDKEIASNEFTYHADSKSFSVEGIAHKEDEVITLTYKTFADGDKIEGINAANQDGGEYNIDAKTYSDIMQSYVNHEMSFLTDIANGQYDNVLISEQDNTYQYLIQNPEQTDSYQLNKDASGFSATSIKGEKTTHINLEFL